MKKITIGASLCLIALTAGLITHAGQKVSLTAIELEADLDVPALYTPSASEILSDKEFKEIVNSEKSLAIPEDDSAIFMGKWVDSFTYTERGGLDPANPRCNLFLGQDGEFGSYGRIIRDYIRKDVELNGDSIFLSNAILGMSSSPHICPNWNKLDYETRVKFWVWTFAAIASAESSCAWDVKGIQGPNDITSGLLQLERGYKLRARRGPNCAGVSPADIRKPYGNLRCGMDIMKQQLVSPNENGELEFDGRIYPGPGMMAQSYWQKLRKVNGSTIGRLMREFKPCR